VDNRAERPRTLEGNTSKVSTSCGNLYITINLLDTKPFEILVRLGKSGGCIQCFLEALTRTINLGLQYGLPAENYIKELTGLVCPGGTWEEGKRIMSCPDAIAKELEKCIENKETKIIKTT